MAQRVTLYDFEDEFIGSTFVPRATELIPQPAGGDTEDWVDAFYSGRAAVVAGGYNSLVAVELVPPRVEEITESNTDRCQYVLNAAALSPVRGVEVFFKVTPDPANPDLMDVRFSAECGDFVTGLKGIEGILNDEGLAFGWIYWQSGTEEDDIFPDTIPVDYDRWLHLQVRPDGYAGFGYADGEAIMAVQTPALGVSGNVDLRIKTDLDYKLVESAEIDGYGRLKLDNVTVWMDVIDGQPLETRRVFF